MTKLVMTISGSSSKLVMNVRAGISADQLTTVLENYVQKESGKGLSKNDFTDEAAQLLSRQSGENTGDQDLSNLIDNSTDTYTSEAKAEHIITLTQAEYDAINTPDANTLYFIPEA